MPDNPNENEQAPIEWLNRRPRAARQGRADIAAAPVRPQQAPRISEEAQRYTSQDSEAGFVLLSVDGHTMITSPTPEWYGEVNIAPEGDTDLYIPVPANEAAERQLDTAAYLALALHRRIERLEEENRRLREQNEGTSETHEG